MPLKKNKSKSARRRQVQPQHPNRGSRIMTHQPMIRSDAHKTIVRHKEVFFVTGVDAGTSSLNHGAVNPGREGKFVIIGGVATAAKFQFPWLRGIARNYEFYRFKKLSFQYKAEAGAITSGRIRLAFDWDPLDKVPASISSANMMNFQDEAEGNIAHNLSLSLRPQDLSLRGSLYVKRTDATVPNQDLRNADLGTLLVVCNKPSLDVVVEILVSYEVEFFVPQVSLNPSPLMVSWQGGSGATPAPTDQTGPYGSNASPPIVVGATEKITVTPTGMIVNVPGRYLKVSHWFGSQVDATSVPVITAKLGNRPATAAEYTQTNRMVRENNTAENHFTTQSYLDVAVGGMELLVNATVALSSITSSLHQLSDWGFGNAASPTAFASSGPYAGSSIPVKAPNPLALARKAAAASLRRLRDAEELDEEEHKEGDAYEFVKSLNADATSSTTTDKEDFDRYNRICHARSVAMADLRQQQEQLLSRTAA